MEPYNEFLQSLKYQERYVAFLDVLGWSRFIELSATEEGKALVNEIGQCLRYIEFSKQSMGLGKLDCDLRITYFSDCIIISVSDKYDWPLMFTEMIYYVIESFMQSGFTIRGGISKGKLIHTDTMTFGPALNRAHYLESEKARYPRVILDEPLTQNLSLIQERFEDTKNPQRVTRYQKLWRKDEDGYFFFDYLQDPILLPGKPPKHFLPKRTIGRAREIILTSLGKYDRDDEIYIKYQWMGLYYNQILDEYPNSGYEKIEFSHSTENTYAPKKSKCTKQVETTIVSVTEEEIKEDLLNY